MINSTARAPGVLIFLSFLRAKIKHCYKTLYMGYTRLQFMGKVASYKSASSTYSSIFYFFSPLVRKVHIAFDTFYLHKMY